MFSMVNIFSNECTIVVYATHTSIAVAVEYFPKRSFRRLSTIVEFSRIAIPLEIVLLLLNKIYMLIDYLMSVDIFPENSKSIKFNGNT